MVAGVSKLANLPVSLPETPIPEDVNVEAVAKQFGDVFTSITNSKTFVGDAVWRDTFALTGTLRTFYSASGVAEAWKGAVKNSATPVNGSLRIIPQGCRVMRMPNGSAWVEVSGSFKLRTRNGLIGKCTLFLGVVPHSGDWSIWSMRTILDDIEDWPSVNHYEPQLPGNVPSSVASTDDFRFDVVVVGGGQAGLSVAGRLQAIGVDYILLDRYDRIGDSWATRYDSARLHTIREYAHLPFDRTFPENIYQEFLTKDDLARGYQDWTRKYSIDQHIWTKTDLQLGRWDEQKQEWILQVVKLGVNQHLKCRFVVMATGAGGQIPSIPTLPEFELFRGTVLHSQSYTSAKDWQGKRGIVVGTANTAHDIADDMYKAGMSLVTMIQRSRTYVLPCEYWQKLSSRTYNSQFPTELADKLQMTGPYAVGRLMIKSGLDAMADQEPERFEALERVGFLTESHGDIMWHLTERAGGHYMDIGTSRKIADHKIKVKSNAAAVKYTVDGLQFSDGSIVPADVIVWATGFEINMRHYIRRLFGHETAAKIDDYFSVDDEGEIRGAWKLQHPGLIMHGMACGQARFFSKYIALQIKAVLENHSFTVYNQTPIAAAASSS